MSGRAKGRRLKMGQLKELKPYKDLTHTSEMEAWELIRVFIKGLSSRSDSSDFLNEIRGKKKQNGTEPNEMAWSWKDIVEFLHREYIILAM